MRQFQEGIISGGPPWQPWNCSQFQGCGASPHKIQVERALLSQLKRTLSTCILHGSLEEHVFNKYPESSCGVLDEDVGYGAY